MRFRYTFSLCVLLYCLSIYVSLSHSSSLSFSIYLPFSSPLSLSPFTSVANHLSLSLCLSIFSLFPPIDRLSLSPSLSLSISLSLSLSLSLYPQQLCDSSNKELAAVGVELRRRLVNTRENVMKVTGSEDFSNGFQLLKVRTYI